MPDEILHGLPTRAPAAPESKLRFADVSYTKFAGIYRGKKYHESDISAMLDRAIAVGCERIMLTGMSLTDVDFNLSIATSKPENVYITVGIHPYHVTEIDQDPGHLDLLKQRIQDLVNMRSSPVAAFGELGLDYDHLEWADKETQQKAFKDQLDIAIQFDLPLFLHCRAAFEDFASIIRPYVSRLSKGGLVHSFVGTKQEMQALVEMGFDISVNGFSFKTAESLQMTACIPLEKLQIETDAPWGTIQTTSEVAKRYWTHSPPTPPSKKRDKFQMGSMVKERNESCMIDRVAFIVAGLKGITVEEVTEAAWNNSVRMFGLGVNMSSREV